MQNNNDRPILPAESNQSLGSPSSMRELLDRPNPGKINTGSFSDSNAKLDVFTRLSAAVAASESIPALIAEINAMLPDGYEVREKAKTEQQPAEDMSDWRNWREGDLVECVNGASWARYATGGVYSVGTLRDTTVEIAGLKIHEGLLEDFRFHSRPVTK